MQEGSKKAILAALLANAGIAVAKIVGFFFTGAASMLAEAVHSGADTSNQGLLFLGGRRARRRPTPVHPFGYGRERYFWSFVVAMVLFSLGGLFAIFEGVEKLRHPHELESVGWAIGILTVAIGLETYSFRTAIREANHVKGGEGWWPFIRHTKLPELPVVLLEDLGALLGLTFALTGVVLATITHNPRFDALGSVAIGVLLVTIAIVLAIEMKSLLIGESASPAREKLIGDTLTAHPAVRTVIHVKTLHLGPDELLVGAKLEMDPAMSIRQLAEAIDDTERSLRAAVPEARVVYIEPDIYRVP